MTLSERQAVVERAIRDVHMIREELRQAGVTDGEPFFAHGVCGLIAESERIDQILSARDEVMAAAIASKESMARLIPTVPHMTPVPYAPDEQLVLDRDGARMHIDATTKAGYLTMTIVLPATKTGEVVARLLVTEFVNLTAPVPTESARDTA